MSVLWNVTELLCPLVSSAVKQEEGHGASGLMGGLSEETVIKSQHRPGIGLPKAIMEACFPSLNQKHLFPNSFFKNYRTCS